MKASDSVFAYLKSKGLEHIFCVSGGTIAHLMESARTSGLESIHFHHEQAAAMAADGYARIKKKPAIVLVTNGGGASNCITGVLGAFQDSVPMIVISGQAPTRQTSLVLRQLGCQEANAMAMVGNITKYAVTIREPEQFAHDLPRAYEFATTPRMGPVWIEIPLDMQAWNI